MDKGSDWLGPDYPHSRGFFPEGDTLSSTWPDAQRHAHVRAGFMEALLADPRVVHLFDGWARTLAKAAKRAKPPKWRLEVPPLDALAFVTKELGLDWPWCAMELLDTFGRMVELRIEDPRQARRPLVADLLAPPVTLHFETQPGESVAEAQARLFLAYLAVSNDLRASEKAATPKNAKGPKQDRTYLHRWGRWVYERHVAKPARKVTKIAAENHQLREHFGRFEDCDCRAAVRKDIAEAKRLLSLSAFRLIPPGD